MKVARILLLLASAIAAGTAAAQGGFRLPPGTAPQGPGPVSPGLQTPGPGPGPGAPASGAPGLRAAPLPPGKIVLVDRIVAVVNTEVITQKELNDPSQVALAQLAARRVASPPRDVLDRQVLEQMIMDRAQLQFAKESGIKVDDLQLDRTIARIAEQNKLSLPEFRRVLERDGVTFDKFRDEIRNEITLSRLREREVDQRIQISESEIDNFIADQEREGPAGAGAGAGDVNISHILVRVPDQASPEQVADRQKRATAALMQVRSGTQFGQVAASFSDAPDALQGGEMGWRPMDRLPELFAEALGKLKPGDVTNLLRSPAGFHIIRLNERRGASGPVVVEQTRARHILLRTNERVAEGEALRKLELLRRRIVQGADFAELARLNSDDGSAARGGDLGWLMPGDTVPEFEKVMNALKIDEVSEPVRSPFGLHIIQVTERRNADVSGDRKRLEARKILTARKSDEAYQEWLRQLRDRAYVEYRLE